MTIAAALAVEIVQFAPESLRTQQWFSALASAAPSVGIDVVRTEHYRGAAPWLLLWGPGAPARADVMRRHVAAGGHVLALDLAYWDRLRKARVSIDAAHPHAWVMRQAMPPDRFRADYVPTGKRWNPEGPVIIAGLGDKARVQYGPPAVDAWEHAMFRACKARWPKRRVLYRKKKPTSPAPAWTTQTSGQDIDLVLNGASLVITWHSNVAIDALRWGIPVICQDGAAAAICPLDFGDADPTPISTALRDQFLANLAYFQWAPGEARDFWRWIGQVLT